jgi:hypothetical protein
VGGRALPEPDLRRLDRSGVDSPILRTRRFLRRKSCPVFAWSGFGTVRHLEITPGIPSLLLPDRCSRTTDWLPWMLFLGVLDCPRAHTPLGAQRGAVCRPGAWQTAHHPPIGPLDTSSGESQVRDADRGGPKCRGIWGSDAHRIRRQHFSVWPSCRSVDQAFSEVGSATMLGHMRGLIATADVMRADKSVQQMAPDRARRGTSRHLSHEQTHVPPGYGRSEIAEYRGMLRHIRHRVDGLMWGCQRPLFEMNSRQPQMGLWGVTWLIERSSVYRWGRGLSTSQHGGVEGGRVTGR